MTYQFEEQYRVAPYDDLLQIYRHSFADNFPLPALTDYVSGKTISYGDLARRIARLHLFFELAGIVPGDKIALLGRNTPNWVITFMATVTYGAIIVPVLNDFNPADAQHIINHSDAVMLFVADGIFPSLDFDAMPELRAVVSLDTRTVIAERAPRCNEGRRTPTTHKSIVTNLTRNFRKRYPGGFAPPDIVFGHRSKLHYQNSRVLSFLPLAHAYGCAFDMLVPLAVGSHITLLGKTPTPVILLRAIRQVRPSLIICVPLILEKIYRKVVVPMITRKPIRWVLAVPGLEKAVYSIIRSKLVDAFGGAFEEVIVGGAPLNSEVEDFLVRIRFPMTVGFGMTECGPLISYSPWRRFEPGSAGRTLKGIMEARIVPDSTLPERDGHPQGEIIVRGLNVMKGYYKNPEATAAAIDSDGWLHTGDMGWLSGPADRTVHIRGRYKTMILTANGQNIYPEEIEAKLSNMPYVNECLVIERRGHLVALCHPDADQVARDGLSDAQLSDAMHANLAALNALVAPYERVQDIEIMPQEFEKTPKRSIRRFLYK